MSTGDLIDDDPDVGAAVQKILAKGPEALGDGPVREDPRENRTDREEHERAEDADLDERSAERVEAKAEEGDKEVANEDEQFLEIPGETEDAEPVKIPLSEAAEAVKQFRQMQGDIATAVTRAETEAHEKQDAITGQMHKVFDDLSVMAAATYKAMQAYLPQPPDESLRHSDPQGYYDQKLYHEEHIAYMERVKATIKQADDARKASMGQQDQTMLAREVERAARYIPAFKDEKTREARKTEITNILGKHFGVTKADMDGTFDHRFWRMADKLATVMEGERKAPEVRKAVQEKAAKIVNGKLPPRDPSGTGRFISEDRKALRETGSVDAAARLFMRSGVTKGL